VACGRVASDQWCSKSWRTMPRGEEWRAAVAAEPGPDQEGQIRRGGDDAADVQYPAWPRYKGTGDVNAASSFECLME
jgi:hypothetical protein